MKILFAVLVKTGEREILNLFLWQFIEKMEHKPGSMHM
jgi:hypothetical protein